MFTGIVQSQAKVLTIKTNNNLSRLTVGVEEKYISALDIGASVAINGVCLTAVEFGQHDENQAYICFDVIDETLRVTNLAHLTADMMVNLERSLKAGDEIGGHMVSGHVHCQGELLEKKVSATNCALTFSCDTAQVKYILEKGFIAINGVSLTVGQVGDAQFNVHLIPETLSRTNIGALEVGQKVNIEFDQQTITIVKTIERLKL
ncbi:riboflavin synthase subunit alpha [Colwelliaceae bacterium 6471]